MNEEKKDIHKPITDMPKQPKEKSSDVALEIKSLQKEIADLKKSVKNKLDLVESNENYIKSFDNKVQTTATSVIQMVESNKDAFDVIFNSLRLHQVGLFFIFGLEIIWLIKYVWR